MFFCLRIDTKGDFNFKIILINKKYFKQKTKLFLC